MKSLQAVRAEHLMTTRDLAEASGVSRSTIYLYEHGKVVPRFGNIKKICRVLDVDPNDVEEFAKAIEQKSQRSSGGSTGGSA